MIRALRSKNAVMAAVARILLVIASSPEEMNLETY
jgi:hypothetical protein